MTAALSEGGLRARLLRRLNLRGQVLLLMGIFWCLMGISNLSGDDPPLIQWLLAPGLSSGVWIGVGLVAVAEAWRRPEHPWIWWVLAVPPIARCAGLLWELVGPHLPLLHEFAPPPEALHAADHHPHIHLISLLGQNLCRVVWPLMMAGIVNRPDETTLVERSPGKGPAMTSEQIDGVVERAVWRSILGIVVKGRPRE